MRLSHGEAEWWQRWVPRGLLVAVLAVVVVMAGASPASAVIVHLKNGRPVSFQPTPGAREGSSGSFNRVRPFDSFFKNLDYNGGPVMSSNRNYTIYWRPSTATAYPAGYKSGVNTYFEDIAHDSGGHENVESVATQYNGAGGEFANYESTFGGELVDEHPYPPNGCKRAPICLTDAQLRTELAKYVTEHGLPTDLTHEYFLLTPEGVESCFEEGAEAECSANVTEPEHQVYCAYHGAIGLIGGGVIIFSNDPFVNKKNCDEHTHHINGSSDSALFGGLSHEHVESITDPEPNNAWTDYATGKNTGYEIGDKCNVAPASEFGAPVGEVEVEGKKLTYNQEINTHKYWYQQEWSNQGHVCRQRLTFEGAQPTATFSAEVGETNKEVLFSGVASTAPGGVKHYSWQFNDGEEEFEGKLFTNLPSPPEESTEPTRVREFFEPGAYNVALTVYAANGTSIGTARTIKVGGSGPTAAFAISAGSVTPGQPLQFDASGSSDTEGEGIAAYAWSFGDGSEATGQKPSHSYAAVGSYKVTLTVTGKDGLSSHVTHEVSVSAVPTAGGGSAGVVSPAVTSAVPATAATGLVITPNSAFNPLHATFNPKTGVITLTGAVGDPGTFSWLLTFQNGKFGVFAASSAKCKKGFVRLKGKCRPSTIAFARGSKAVPGPGAVTFTAKPSASALKALKNALKQKKGLPVSIRLTFQSSRGGSAVSHTQSLTVRLKTK